MRQISSSESGAVKSRECGEPSAAQDLKPGKFYRPTLDQGSQNCGTKYEHSIVTDRALPSVHKRLNRGLSIIRVSPGTIQEYLISLTSCEGGSSIMLPNCNS